MSILITYIIIFSIGYYIFRTIKDAILFRKIKEHFETYQEYDTAAKVGKLDPILIKRKMVILKHKIRSKYVSKKAQDLIDLI